MAPVADGFWPLALADAGEPPLFLASMHCFRSILGPGLKSYLGIIFFLMALGMNLASTYCGLFGGLRVVVQKIYVKLNFYTFIKASFNIK